MKIAFISSEVYPFARTGGLADVSYALPLALSTSGHNVCVFMPRYKAVDKIQYNLKLIRTGLMMKVNGRKKWSAVFESSYIPGVKTYFIDYNVYFGRDGLYDNAGKPYEDNAERFAFFAKAVLKSLKEINFRPDIIHCNDWHTGLIPVYLKSIHKKDNVFKNTRTVFTVHNAGYQGLFPSEMLDIKEVNHSLNPGSIYHSTGISYLKAGVMNSDAVTTVSKKYAGEIQTEEYGYDLAYAFKSIGSRLFGILNAIDHNSWNPLSDKYLPANYSVNDLSGKTVCKLKFQKELGLIADPAIPLAGTIARLVYQKGIDILADALELVLQDENMQFVLIGSGDPDISGKFDHLKKMFPEKIGLFRGFYEKLEHLGEAGMDIFILPSRYEPCGLNQMYSLKYGTVPIVRSTGGLDDVIPNWDEGEKTGNGFKISCVSHEELYNIIRKVIKTYKDKKIWKIIQKNGMQFDYSWNNAVIEYEKVYDLVLKT